MESDIEVPKLDGRARGNVDHYVGYSKSSDLIFVAVIYIPLHYPSRKKLLLVGLCGDGKYSGLHPLGLEFDSHRGRLFCDDPFIELCYSESLVRILLSHPI